MSLHKHTVTTIINISSITAIALNRHKECCQHLNIGYCNAHNVKYCKDCNEEWSFDPICPKYPTYPINPYPYYFPYISPAYIPKWTITCMGHS